MSEDSDQEVFNERTIERLVKLRAEYTAKNTSESPRVPSKRTSTDKKKDTKIKKTKSPSKTFEKQLVNTSNPFTKNGSSTPKSRTETSGTFRASVESSPNNVKTTSYNTKTLLEFFSPKEPNNSRAGTRGI